MRSKFEEQVAADLTKRRIKFEYEPVTFELELAGKQPRTRCSACGGTGLIRQVRYTPDFYLPKAQTFVEAKGRFTPKDRRLALAFKAYVTGDPAGPPMYYHCMLLMRDNTLSKASKTRYSDWCKANGVTFAIGTKVPQEWVR